MRRGARSQATGDGGHESDRDTRPGSGERSGFLGDASLSAFGAGDPLRMMTGARRASNWCCRRTRPTPPSLRTWRMALAILAGHGADGPKHLHEEPGPVQPAPPDGSDPLVLMCAGVAGLFLREAEAGRDLLDRALVQARPRADSGPAALLFMLGRATRPRPSGGHSLEPAMRMRSGSLAIHAVHVAGGAVGLAGSMRWRSRGRRVPSSRPSPTAGRDLQDGPVQGLVDGGPGPARAQARLRPEGGLSHHDRLRSSGRRFDQRPDLSPAPDNRRRAGPAGTESPRLGRSPNGTSRPPAKGPAVRARACCCRAKARVADDRSYVQGVRGGDAAPRGHDGHLRGRTDSALLRRAAAQVASPRRCAASSARGAQSLR